MSIIQETNYSKDNENMKDTYYAKIADIEWAITHEYAHVKELMSDYIVKEPAGEPVPVVSTKEGIETIRGEHPDFETFYCESDWIYREIAQYLPRENRMLMHGAVITYGEDAYMFTAPSGTGKSTHIALWQKHLKKGVDIVNGDKPILAVEDQVTVYGTPWGGKENWQKNRKAPLKALVLIEQAKENSIQRIPPNRYVPMLMQQVYLPEEERAATRTLELLDELTAQIPFYLLRCDMSEEAVKCSFEELTGLSMEEVNR